MTKLLTLYPEIKPYKTGMLDTGDGHSLYWEACGNPKGKPVLFLHGGPGSGCAAWQRGFFNPKKYNAILFDQRGCGRSKPHSSLKNNTTPHLISDIEKLRNLLGIEKWAVFGGSWGSTLALAYADAHPKNVTALILRGIFLCRDSEIRDMYFPGGTLSRLFPDVFEQYISLLPPAARKNPITSYKKLFNGKNPARAYDAWTRLESSTLALIVTPEQLEKGMDDKKWVKGFALIENHYFLKHGYVDGDALIKRIGKKTGNIPFHIVQGRYDAVCPFKTAWELHKAVPRSRLHIVADAGHSAKEAGITHALVKIMNELE